MKTPADDLTQPIVSEQLELHGYMFLENILSDLEIFPKPAIDLVIRHSSEKPETTDALYPESPVAVKQCDGGLVITLQEAKLLGLPLLALQGWIDHLMARHVIESVPEHYRVNFERQILPLFPVVGAAENILLQIMEHLSTALRKYLATKLVIDCGHATPQLYSAFSWIAPNPARRETYERMVRHHWVRGVFICQLLKEFLPLALLAYRGIGFSRELKSYWWRVHGFFLPDDQGLVEDMSSIPQQFPSESFSFLVVEMYRHVVVRLLAAKASV